MLPKVSNEAPPAAAAVGASFVTNDVKRLEAEVASLRRRVVELETGGAAARSPAKITPEVLGSCVGTRELLLESRPLFIALCTNLPNVVFVKDVSGRYAIINQQFVELFEKSSESVFGKTDYDLFPAEVAARIRRTDDQIIEDGRPLDYEGIIPTPRGPRTYRTLKFLVHDSQGQLIGLAGISIDMSEVKRLEAERDAMYTQVIEAQKAVLRELEAPLLPIATGVLVMPLIGGLDEERLRHIEEALWPRVVEQRARFVILDLTGAKMTEPGVPARLLQLAQGAKLLGARVVVTGVRPDAALALVTAKMDMKSLLVLGTLENAITYTLRQKAAD
ncbi:MAG: PAS domain-containing protein [Byssovorax sp.]